MSELDYLVWFIATAIMIATVLTVGTLAAAGILPRRRHAQAHRADDVRRSEVRPPAEEPVPHRHRDAA